MNHIKSVQRINKSVGLVEFEWKPGLRFNVHAHYLKPRPVIANCGPAGQAPQNKSSNLGLFFGIWHHPLLLNNFGSPALPVSLLKRPRHVHPVVNPDGQGERLRSPASGTFQHVRGFACVVVADYPG